MEPGDFTELAAFTAALILERSADSIMEGWPEAFLLAAGRVLAEGSMGAEASTAAGAVVDADLWPACRCK